MSLVLKKLENLSRTENSVPFLNFPLFGRIAENELFLPQERPSSPLSTFYSAFYLFVTSRHNPFPDALHLVLSCIICSRGDLCIHPNFERICALAAVPTAARPLSGIRLRLGLTFRLVSICGPFLWTLRREKREPSTHPTFFTR